VNKTLPHYVNTFHDINEYERNNDSIICKSNSFAAILFISFQGIDK